MRRQTDRIIVYQPVYIRRFPMTSIHSQDKWKRYNDFGTSTYNGKHTPSGVGSAKNQRPSTVGLG